MEILVILIIAIVIVSLFFGNFVEVSIGIVLLMMIGMTIGHALS